MKLVIGGEAQGKLNYVLQNYRLERSTVWEACLPDGEAQNGGSVVVNRFHEWVRSRLRDGGHPEEEAASFLEREPDCVIISNEVGNGIVPVDAFEREYRERLGRILIEIAGRAEEVERVVCGIGQRIK